MNWRQKAVLIIGFMLILVTGLFPPWVQSWDFVAGGEDVWFRIGPGAEGYSWIFHPPGVPAWVNRSFRAPNDAAEFEGFGDKEVSASGMKVLLKSVRMPGSWRAHIDTTRLAIEWLIIASGVFFGVFVLAQRKPNLPPPPALSKGDGQNRLTEYVRSS
jgi:hypothetical protein